MTIKFSVTDGAGSTAVILTEDITAPAGITPALDWRIHLPPCRLWRGLGNAGSRFVDAQGDTITPTG